MKEDALLLMILRDLKNISKLVLKVTSELESDKLSSTKKAA